MEAVVGAAGFSPIKGTRHPILDAIDLDPSGVVGDRRFCFIDAEAGRVLRTVQHPRLLSLDAHLDGPTLHLTSPDGERVSAVPTPTGVEVTCDYWGRPTMLQVMSGPHADLASRVLGRPVTLAAAAPGAVVYGAGLSILTRASLADLADRLGTAPSSGLDLRRFRASLVIDTDAPAYAEDGWAGRELRLGEAVVRIGAPIGRCAVIDVHPDTGRRSGQLLRTLASYRPRTAAGEPCFGVYADVVLAGRVPVGLRSP